MFSKKFVTDMEKTSSKFFFSFQLRILPREKETRHGIAQKVICISFPFDKENSFPLSHTHATAGILSMFTYDRQAFLLITDLKKST